MPRRKNDGTDPVQPTKPRSRKKKESGSVCSTPSVDQQALMAGQNHPLAGMNVGPMPHPLQNIQQNGNPNLFGGPPDENMVQGMPGPYGPPPPNHPEYFYHHQQPLPGSFQPIYGNPAQHMPGPGPPTMGHPGQFSEADIQQQQQFLLHQQSPSSQPQMPIPPPMMMRQPTLFPPTIPQPPFLEYRLQEINRRLYSYFTAKPNLLEQEQAQWWDAFTYEFFDDSAKMTIMAHELTEMGAIPRKYTIGRLLIPRFYRTIFDKGVSEMYYQTRGQIQESLQQPFNPYGSCALECDNVLVVTKHHSPIPTEAHTSCRLYVEFAPFDQNLGYRILNWMIELRQPQELYSLPPGEVQDESLQDMIKKGGTVTRSGLPQEAFSFLKLCMVLEPMKEIMDKAKAMTIAPRDAMTQLVYEHHTKLASNMHPPQNMPPQINPSPMPMPAMSALPPSTPSEEGTTKKQVRKRPRKTPANAAMTPSHNSSPKKKGTGPNTPPINNLPPNNFAACNPFNQMSYHQDVLTVGEPSLMGCELGEQDERTISRIENSFSMNPGVHMSSPHTSMPQQMPPTSMLSQCMPPPHPSMTQGPPQMPMSGGPMGGENAQLMMADFDMNSSLPPTTAWSTPTGTS